MKKVYLSLIAMIFAISVSAQTQVYMTYQNNGNTYTFQAHVTDSNLMNAMTYQWDINGTILNGQTVTYTFPGTGYYGAQLTGTGQGLTLTDFDTIYISSNPCNLVGSAVITHISAYNANDGAIDFTISGGQAPYLYSWSNGASTQDLSNVSSGYYTVLVQDQANCTDTFMYYVGIDSIINPCNINLSANVQNETWAGFNDGSIDLTVSNGTAPYYFTWYYNNTYLANTEDLNQITAGTYTVHVVDQDSCTASATYYVTNDSVNIVNCNIQATYAITYPSSLTAQDGAIDITIHNGNPPYYYYWQDGTNTYYTEDLNQIGAGVYNLFVIDQDSCMINETYYVYPDSLNTLATYSYNIDTCLNQIASASIISYSVNANNTITVVWEFVEAGTANTSTITVTYQSNQAFVNGRYQFVLSIICNGTKSSVIETYSYYLDVATSIKEVNATNITNIYPNPADQQISIDINSEVSENTKLNIYNSLGMLVFSQDIDITTGSSTLNISVNDLKEGVYYININGHTQSFIKQ